MGVVGGRRRGRQRKRQRHDQEHQPGKYRERRLPAEIVDQRDAERREQELAERSCRGAGAECDAALFRWQQLAECRQHQVERATGEAETDQHAGAEIERQRRRGVAHQQQAAGIEHRAHRDHAEHAEAIGDGAGNRLSETPEKVLQRQRQSEYVAAPGGVAAHRLHEETEAGAWAEAEKSDSAAADDDDQRRPPVDGAAGRTKVTCGGGHLAFPCTCGRPRASRPNTLQGVNASACKSPEAGCPKSAAQSSDANWPSRTRRFVGNAAGAPLQGMIRLIYSN